MPHISRRLLLPLCLLFSVIGALLIASVWSFANNADRHLGADYLGFASEVVRGQQDGLHFQQAIESLADSPDPCISSRPSSGCGSSPPAAAA